MALEAPNVALPMQDQVAGPTADQRARVAEVNEKFIRWRNDRIAHEITWFVNSAMVRGLHWGNWGHWGLAVSQLKMQSQQLPSYRVRVVANRILQYFRSRRAKFLAERMEPLVVPFKNTRQAILNAKGTKRAFDYYHVKEGLELKYRKALNWANVCSKGFWWFYWDPNKKASVQTTDPLGQPQVQDAILGDVCVEPGGPFELLVADPGADWIGLQPEIMRIKLRLVSDVKQRYGEVASQLQGEVSYREAFQYQRMMATLSARMSGGTGANDPVLRQDPTLPYIVVKELFTKPNGQYPQGRYVAVAGDTLLQEQAALPYGFADMDNPYPVVEFPDMESPGQFWPTTMVEQLTGLQREYNMIRSKVVENIQLMCHPKVIVSTMAQWPEGAWTKQPGEVVKILLPPGVPPPQIITPPNIAADVWRELNLIKEEFSEISALPPAAQGAQDTDVNSGFQVNLLQEGADSVHAQDIRLHELAFEEAWYKIRRMMKQGYTLPRLVSIEGRNYAPEVFEFSSDSIDEHAQIRIFAGGGLSNSPAIRNKQIMDMFAGGILGNMQDPEVQKKALGALDLHGLADIQEDDQQDTEQAARENDKLRSGVPAAQLRPDMGQNHEEHWTTHWNITKAPEWEDWLPQAKQEFYRHIVDTAFLMGPGGPVNAFHIAQYYQLPDKIQQLAPLVMPAAPPGPPPGSPGAPSPGPPPGPPPGAQGQPPPGGGRVLPFRGPSGPPPQAPPPAPPGQPLGPSTQGPPQAP